MVEKSIQTRPYVAFLSHAHVDKKLVNRLYELLTKVAKLPVWYDSTSLQVSKAIASELPTCISQCRNIIIFLSQASVKSGWVKDESNFAIGHRNIHPKFQIIPIRIDDCEVPNSLETTKRIDLIEGRFSLESFSSIIHSFYDFDISLDFNRTKDVFVSRSWRNSEAFLPTEVCRTLSEAGFRLVGDSEDQEGFDGENRIASIMSSCGGFIAIAPHRGEGKTSKYILEEIELARSKNLPGFVVADPAVTLPDYPDLEIVTMGPDMAANQVPELFGALEELTERWRKPQNPHYVFFATDLDQSNEARNNKVRQLVHCVTGMPCIMGEDIHGEHMQDQIRDRIENASIMVADISDENLNTCVEAGIAKGTRTRLHLIAKKPRHKPPFMFRDLQVSHYGDDLELLAVVHRLLHPYRRRIINYELD